MNWLSAPFLKLLMIVAIGVSLSACNTIRGVGKDIEAGGEAIQKATK
jgi:predicted small secreted protein